MPMGDTYLGLTAVTNLWYWLLVKFVATSQVALYT
jgi:hypothetical protein